MSSNYEALFTLIRLGINHPTDVAPQSIDWTSIQTLASRHGLSGVVLDGIEALRSTENNNLIFPEKLVLAQWIGEVLQGYEYMFGQYRKTIAELAAFYNSHGFKMMVVKGYACSLDWPKPEHRPVGDIDIWLFGRYKEADAALAEEKGIEIDGGHHHHTVFNWGDFLVENHFDFLNVHQHKSNVKLEEIVKKLAEDDTHYVDVIGERVYLPSPNLHALFLLRHAMTHFAASEITLRQLLDWAFFVKKHGQDVDWNWLLAILGKYGMLPMFNIFNAICVENLGFDTAIFPKPQFDPVLKDRVLNDILSPEFSGDEPKGLIRGYLFKYRRWKANQWKHELCFSESLWSAFWTGIWGHLFKPHSSCLG